MDTQLSVVENKMINTNSNNSQKSGKFIQLVSKPPPPYKLHSSIKVNSNRKQYKNRSSYIKHTCNYIHNTHRHTYIHTQYTHTYIYTYTIHTDIHIYIHNTHIHTYIHTQYTHTYIYTYKQVEVLVLLMKDNLHTKSRLFTFVLRN